MHRIIQHLLFSTLVQLFLSPLLGITTGAFAQVIVDRAIVTLKSGGRPIENVVVGNSGTETLYVTAHPDVMTNPGEETEKRVITEDLLVSPKRFALGGGAQRTVRLLLKKTYGETEQVYRVKFVPEAKGFGPEDAGEIKGKRATLKVLTGMGILILVEPKAPSPSLTWTRSDSKIIFRNEGNVNIFLEEGKACKNEGSECANLPAGRLYPGNTLEAPTSRDRLVTYRKQTGEVFETVTIPPGK